MNGCCFFNFSRSALAARFASAAIVCLALAATVGIGQACGQSTDGQVAQVSQSAQVAEIVKELKSDRFENRQAATRRLFELGPAILPALEKIERSASLEQNQRLENLKVVFRAINAGQSSPVARRAWLDFRDVGFETRDLILEKLLTLREYEAHFALLEQLQPQQIREVFEDNGNYYSQVVELCRGEKWEVIERLLSMPIMWKYQPILCARFHFLMGTLEKQITLLRKRLDDRTEEQKPNGRDEELEVVIELLTFQHQYEAAGKYVAKVPDWSRNRSLQMNAENRLLLDRGDWKTLAQRAVLADGPAKGVQPHVSCSPWEYVLLKQYGEGVDAGVKAIEEVEAMQRENDTFDAGMLAALSILTCDWEKAKTGVELGQNILSLVLLHPILNRPQAMQDLVGAGDTFESRTQWAKERREEIDKLIRKIRKEVARSRASSEKAKALLNDAREKVNYYLFVCERWLDFGWEKETILYLRELYLMMQDVEQLANLKNSVMKGICDPARSEATWEFLSEAGYTDSQLASLAGSEAIFGDKVGLAQFLNAALYESVKAPEERLQRISFLLNSTLVPTNPATVEELYPEGFDLDAELSRVRHESTGISCWQISQIYEFHQRHREAQQWKEMAALKGQADAVFSLAEDALANEEFTKAARMFDAHFVEASQAYSLGLSSHAWKMAGDEQTARQRMFYASVIPQYYGSTMTEFYARFVDDERGHWVSDLARLDSLMVDSSRYEELRALRTAMNCSKSVNPIESANFGKRRMLKSSAGNSLGEYYNVSRYIIESRTQDVMSAVEEGDFEAVKSIVDQVNQFSPGSPSLVEKIVPRLDELGQSDLADYITDQTAAFFEDTLVRYPYSSNSRNNYAWLLACAKRRLETVLRHAKMAVQLQPDQATYIDTLAESHFARGEFDDAIAVIERSIALDPRRRYYRNQLKKYQAARSQR